jgi:predicted helicase
LQRGEDNNAVDLKSPFIKGDLEGFASDVAYQPFEGICLTDTFQLYEKEDLIDQILVQNSARRKRQKKLDIRVIIGNPPYSAGQTSANDNNQNVAYPYLDERIRSTYAERSTATNKNALYDSYIRAIRWASDRIGDSGVIGFVTNAGFTEANTADGLRQCLAEEFSSIYVFHLRGNQRTSGELSRKEGGKIFGSGSRAPIAISLLVKNPEAVQHGQIFFHDIGDYLSREDKLGKVSDFASVAGITVNCGWQTIEPDQHGDWLKQRDDSFGEFIVLGDKEDKATKTLFASYSCGVKTQRDAWCYNAAKACVTSNMTSMIGFYNNEVARFNQAFTGFDKKTKEAKLDGFIDTDPTQISWSRALKQDLINDRHFAFESECLMPSQYRPFNKQWLYFNRRFNEMVYQMPRIFPESASVNRVICVTGRGETAAFTALITDVNPNLHMIASGQCFPLYLYDEPDTETPDHPDLFAISTHPKAERKRRDAITDEGLAHFLAAYPGETISKEDVFYYVYGLLHSPEYRERYADNLSKELPRIPCVKTAADFWAFSKAGRALAELHLNYETVPCYPVKINVGRFKQSGTGDNGGSSEPCANQTKTAGSAALDPAYNTCNLTDADYRVEKMKYGKKGKDKDLTTLHYNDKITLSGIPLEAYDYIVNGKPALDWVVERQCVKTDKDSGILNDANDWALDTMNNPRYPLELFMRVITVSLETMKIVNNLPRISEE